MTQTEQQQEHSTSSKMCPHYEAAMELLARRWTGLILTSLMEKSARFSEIGVAVDGISDRMLSQRLVELEDIGMIQRKVDATQRPVLVEYSSTQMARELAPVFDALQGWAEKWMPVQVED
ncbi:MAG: helix-turn-helix transcriptional regulator [Chloroflexi bacterium]|nr:helix-turn-helix transcriptional regulator [Chloroflexota bacterium]